MLTGINHITLAVKDVDSSFAFYKDLLQLTPLCKWDKGAYFLVGEFWFCLNHDEKTDCKSLLHSLCFQCK
jgi:glutathione S-transferase fosA5